MRSERDKIEGRCIEKEKEKDGRRPAEVEKGFSLRQEDLGILAGEKVAVRWR